VRDQRPSQVEPFFQLRTSEPRLVKYRIISVTKPFSKTLTGHKDKARAVVFSPDGKLVASGSNNCMVGLWDLAKRAARTIESHKSWVSAAVFSPDGKLIASGSGGRTLRLAAITGIAGVAATVIDQKLKQSVMSGPRFGGDTHTRRMRGIRETVSKTVSETVSETQTEASVSIYMRLALRFPR
jgi:roadblock/LC7 domain-containing protein